MNRSTFRKGFAPALLPATLALLACGCGGGGGTIGPGGGSAGNGGNGSGGNGGTTTNASLGGIWRGTDAASGQQMLGIIAETGEFNFLRSDNIQYVGTATTSVNNVTGNIEGIVPLGFTFGDGATHATGTLTGTVHERQTLSTNIKFATDLGSVSSGVASLNFDTLYNDSSALSTVAGNYTSTTNGPVFNINSNGAVFLQDPATGCVLNGTVSIINARYNAYRVLFSYSNCQNQSVALNGISFSGLAMLDRTISPVGIVIAATGATFGKKYGVIYRMSRS